MIVLKVVPGLLLIAGGALLICLAYLQFQVTKNGNRANKGS